MNRARTDRDGERVLITPEGIALPVRLASRGARAGALLIDITFMLVAALVFAVALRFIADGAGKAAAGGGGATPAGNFITIAMILLGFMMRYGYFLVFELGPRGATPGKRLTGIRIAARGGGHLSTEMVLARNLLRDIELFLPVFALFYLGLGDGPARWAMAAWLFVFALFPFFNRDRLRAGDLVAGTWVVEAPRHALAPALSTGPAAATGTSHATGAAYRFSDAELAVYGEYELQTLERVLRERREEALVAVHEAICRKIGWSPGAGDELAFLQAYYTQLRARLEAGMRLGQRKADKFAE